MSKTLRTLHTLGLVLFLGSIFTFTLISTLTAHAGLAELVFAREVIAAGTTWLTLPGLLAIASSGVAMSARGWGFGRHGWLTFKQLAMLAILANTFVFILPAARDCLALARVSLAAGTLSPAYHGAYVREAIPGAVNVLLSLASVLAAILRPRARRAVSPRS